MLQSLCSTIENYISKEEDLNARRKEYAVRLMKQYPGCIPMICHKVNRNGINLKLNIKSKHLVPGDYQFIRISAALRAQADLKPGESLFFFIDNRILIPNMSTMNDLYNRFQAADGMLHVHYTTENTFG